MKDEIILTPEGYLELETELNELKTVVRPRVIKDLKDARAQGEHPVDPLPSPSYGHGILV